MEFQPVKLSLKRIASIDLGTNSFHAVIVDIYPDGSFYTIDKFKEMVLLGEGGMQDELSEEAMERGVAALKKIKMLCEHQNVEKILAIATSAIREAINGGEFIQRVMDEVGIKINAISGKMEAELIASAVQHGVSLDEDPVLMIDIGGGSVEFILGNQKKVFFLSSKKLGVARMSAKLKMDPPAPNEIKALKDHYSTALKDVAEAFAQNRTNILIGSSGTMQNIGMMIALKKKKSPNITLNELEFTSEEFNEFYKKAITLSHKQRLKLKGLDEKRVDYIVPGLVLVNYILDTFGIKKVRISTQALREGIIIRYIKKEMEDLEPLAQIQSPRRRSVFELLRKCDWHKDHSSHVADMALIIFDALKVELNLDDSDRELLEYAALMHDIGYYISHKSHHKHALYIIRNSDLRGFREEEIEIMANVARYHRRSTPKSRHPHYDALSEETKKRVIHLSAILRVADGLDRSHYQNVRVLHAENGKKKLTFRIETEADPQLEIWGAKRKSQLLQEVTGKKIVIEPVKKGAYLSV
jgi:exopolyphosphatase/guanosine-5'-triphosphate,3'-diphosphate pyrophosphatase